MVKQKSRDQGGASRVSVKQLTFMGLTEDPQQHLPSEGDACSDPITSNQFLPFENSTSSQHCHTENKASTT